VSQSPAIIRRITLVTLGFGILLLGAAMLGITLGSSGASPGEVFRAMVKASPDTATLHAIIWKIRMPRVFFAMAVGAALSVGGLVFQALLRNPLAEPYILGISGGAAIGAIIGILMGLSRFPGVSLTAFAGSLATLGLLLFMSSGRFFLRRETLLLSGVMVNAFCSAVIMFLISMTQDARLHNIIFWMMGDLGLGDLLQAGLLAAILLPCLGIVLRYTNTMNLLLMGRELAQTTGINIRRTTIILLGVTSLMISATVSQCGLIAFVGLVVPHTLRLFLGPDHRVLFPACLLGGGTYMILCDVLARTLPREGEMSVGVITALIGAPLFIILLKRTN
jgi:iron complex transport system permease protein